MVGLFIGARTLLFTRWAFVVAVATLAFVVWDHLPRDPTPEAQLAVRALRPDIRLNNLEIENLPGHGPTVMGVFQNLRDNEASNFRWAMIGGDGSTPIAFDDPDFSGLMPEFDGKRSETLPLFSVSDIAKYVPASYRSFQFRDVYFLPPPLGERPDGIYVPLFASCSFVSAAKEHVKKNLLLYVRLTER